MEGANESGTYGSDFGPAFQLHVLSVMCQVPDLVLRFRSVLHHAYFTSNIHRLICKALLVHVDEYHSLPSKVLLLQNVGELTDEKTLASAKVIANELYSRDTSDAVAVADKVVEFGRTQAMVNAVIESSERLAKGNRDILGLIQEAGQVGVDVTNIGIDYKLAERSSWYVKSLDDDTRVATGMPHLDMALGGGGQRGCIYVVLGAFKRGKSQLLVNVGFGGLMNAAGYDVVYYSHEMSAQQIAKRFDARLAGPLFELRTTDRAAYAQAIQDRAQKFVLGRLHIQSYPTRTCPMSKMRAHLNLLKSMGFHPDLVISDYCDIQKPERRLGEMRHEQAGIYEDFRGLVGEFDAVGWTASQQKASAFDKATPTINDFAEAGEKAAIMDAGIAIAQTADEKILGRCRLVLVGQRDEADGLTVECTVRRDRCLFRSTALYDSAMTLISGEPSGVPIPPNGKSGGHKKQPANPNAFQKLAAKAKHPPTPSKKVAPLA